MPPFELEAVKNHPDEGPVCMVNLVKFREKSLDGDGSGRDAYGRYAAVVGPMVEARGGVVVWVGSVDHLALHEGGDAPQAALADQIPDPLDVHRSSRRP